MAKRRKGRAINGVLLLDKPYDMSSNSALQKVKRLYGAQKAGHTGALDPLATGMLPICLGEGTKFSQFLLDTDKTYQVTAKLGIRTTTSDIDGDIVAEKPVSLTNQALAAALDTFRGTSKQVPSMYSALKYQGQPLYKYAREGIEVPRESRDITVYHLELLRFEGNEIDLGIHVSKGTYIRTIIDDLGEILGCGAHVSKLHRSAVGNYPVSKMVSLADLNTLVSEALEADIAAPVVLDPLLLPMQTACDGIPAVFVDPMSASFLRHGNPVQCSHVISDGIVQVYIGDDINSGEFIGIGQIDDNGLVAPKRIVVADDVLANL